MSETQIPNESAASVARAGWLIIAFFFGVIGSWSLAAPLNGAVVAQGVVKVEGNRKSIQHLDGGIVREIRVREGATVAQGDVLLTLDDTEARAAFDVLSKQDLALEAAMARLKADAAGDAALLLPADLAARKDHDDVTRAWQAEEQRFTTRLAADASQRQLVVNRIAQLEAQIAGADAQTKALGEQLASIRDERESLVPLEREGLVARPRILGLERSASGLEAQLGELNGRRAEAAHGIAEQRQRLVQLESDRRAETAAELRDTEAKLAELAPRLANAAAVLARTTVRSPYAGRVVGLAVFSVGGVIGRGERIMDIVPAEDALVVEAQVKVEEVSDVRPAMKAEVHLTPYKQRSVPVVAGEVRAVSADRLTDQRSGTPFYATEIRIDRRALAALPNVRLYPGMPVTVTIPTIERTAFSYLVGPFVMSFEEAFRQR